MLLFPFLRQEEEEEEGEQGYLPVLLPSVAHSCRRALLSRMRPRTPTQSVAAHDATAATTAPVATATTAATDTTTTAAA